jgi:hypothetical protein
MWLYVIVGFYVFCLIDMALFLWITRAFSRCKFRSEEEGSTVQIGYEEDSIGKVIPTELSSVGITEEHTGAGESVMHTPEH